MSHPLDGAKLKIVWAKEHLKKVKGEIVRYINTDPHELRREKSIDGRWTSGPHITIQPDETLSLFVGDFLTNARAVLDHVMFQIVLKWFDPPFDPTSKDHLLSTGFPLFEVALNDPQSAEANRFAKLKHFMPNCPADVFATIKRVQPYNGAYTSLWWLHELVNTDKHRLLLIARSEIHNATYTITSPGRSWPVTATGAIDHKIDVFNRGGFSTNAGVSDLPENVKVQYEPTILITFQNLLVPLPAIAKRPIEEVLAEILRVVEGVPAKFDRFF